MTRSAASLILLAVCLPAAAATHTVNVGPGLSFTPSTLTIVAGDSVRFTNKGGLHNVKADDNSFRCARGCDGDGSDGCGYGRVRDAPGRVRGHYQPCRGLLDRVGRHHLDTGVGAVAAAR